MESLYDQMVELQEQAQGALASNLNQPHPTKESMQSLNVDEIVGNAEKTVAVYKTRAENGTLERHFEYKSLGPKHDEILRLLSLGLTNTEIAIKMGVTNATVINVKYSREGRIKLKTLGLERDKMTVVLKDQVSQLGPLAVDTIEEILVDSETPQSVKARTALQLLEMNGLSRTKDDPVNNKLQHAIIEQIVANANNSGLMIVDDPEVEDAILVESSVDEENLTE